MNEYQFLCFNQGATLRPIGVQYLLKKLLPLHSNISDWSIDQSHSLPLPLHQLKTIHGMDLFHSYYRFKPSERPEIAINH